MVSNSNDDGPQKRGRYKPRLGGPPEKHKELLRDLRHAFESPRRSFQKETGIDPNCRGLAYIRTLLVPIATAHVMERFDNVGAKHQGLATEINSYINDLSMVHDEWRALSTFIQANKHTVMDLIPIDAATGDNDLSQRQRRIIDQLLNLVGADLPDIEGEEICRTSEARLLEDYTVATRVSENEIETLIRKLKSISEMISAQVSNKKTGKKGARPDVSKYCFVYLCDQFSIAKCIPPFSARQLTLLASEMGFGYPSSDEYSVRVRRWKEVAGRARGKRGASHIGKFKKTMDRIGIVDSLRKLDNAED